MVFHTVATALYQHWQNTDVTLLLSANEITQLSFISKGNVIVYDDNDNQIHRLGSDSPLLPPVVGDVAFFVGCPQPFSAKVASRGDAQLLVLSRESYLKIKGSFPEQHEMILLNICSKFGLNVKVRLVHTG